VHVVRDVVYARYGERQLKLDLYLPQESGQRTTVPGVVVVRGNGWRSGDKEAFGFIAGQLAKEGFVAASIEYRTSAEATFPAAVHDVKAAVRWMRANAARYRINPGAIGAVGASAGGHLEAMLATSNGAKELEGSGGNSATSSQVQAVVAMACVCNLDLSNQKSGPATVTSAISDFVAASPGALAGAIKAASPVTYVNSRSASLLLLHSQTDPVVPFGLSVEIEGLYRRAGAPVVLKAIDAPNTHCLLERNALFPRSTETVG
jgi:arylsulfatase A